MARISRLGGAVLAVLLVCARLAGSRLGFAHVLCIVSQLFAEGFSSPSGGL